MSNKEQEMKVTNAGLALIRDWNIASENVQDLEKKLEKAKLIQSKKAEELSGWILPSDAKVGDKYLIAFGCGFIECIQHKNKPTSLRWAEHCGYAYHSMISR